MTNQKHKNKPANIERKDSQIFITKINGDEGEVEAVVSVFGIVDLGRDIIHAGAFTKTINERASQIKVVDQHNTDSIFRVIGIPTEMREVGKKELPEAILKKYPNATGGLMTTTKYLLDTPEGAGAFARIKSGAINDYSIGYEVLDADYSELIVNEKKTRVRNIRTVKLWEFSPVIWGMNPATMTASFKADGLESGEIINHVPHPKKVIGDYIHGTLLNAFSHCSSMFYANGYLNEIQWTELSTIVNKCLQQIRDEIPEDIALMPVQYGWNNFDPEIDVKAGRMLSASNTKKIKDAVDNLVEVLNNAGVYEEVQEELKDINEKAILDENDIEIKTEEASSGSTESTELPNVDRKQNIIDAIKLLDEKLK